MEIIKNGFKNERLGIELDVYVIDGKEWFRGKQVANILGYRDSERFTRIVSFKENISTYNVEMCGIKHNEDFVNKVALSEVIQKSRKISKEMKEELLQSLGVAILCSKETKFIGVLKEALSEINVVGVEQYNVDNKYRIDFYIPSKNIAVEYDEQQHFTEDNHKKDLERQAYIESKLGCKFIRCSYKDSDIKNVMKVVKEVY